MAFFDVPLGTKLQTLAEALPLARPEPAPSLTLRTNHTAAPQWLHLPQLHELDVQVDTTARGPEQAAFGTITVRPPITIANS